MYSIPVVYLFLGLLLVLVIVIAAIPMSLSTLSRKIRRSGRSRH